MALVPWKPLFDMDNFFDDEDWLLPVFPKGQMVPALDLYDNDKEIIAEVAAPGIDPNKTEISIENGYLRVKGEGEEQKEEKKKNYWHKEISHRAFERVVKLPQPVEENKVEATYDKGVLKIVMPKKKVVQSKGKKIQIKTK